MNPPLYQRLSHHDSIRLFKLTNTKSGKEPLTGELITVRLFEAPEYHALSYMWGSDEHREQNILFFPDSHHLALRPNIASALRALRLHRRQGTLAADTHLWIDLICVNQDDKDEKGYQVQQMGSIYENAESVIIWLGQHTHIPLEQYWKGGDYFGRHGKSTLAQPASPLKLKALFWALHNEHWSRTWILQEICLARAVVIVTREHVIDGDSIDSFREQKSWLPEATSEGWKATAELANPHAASYGVISRFEKIWMARSIRYDPGWKPLTLLSTISQLGTGSHCFEPRDKVYGFLGIGSDCSSLPVDYRIDTATLFWEVVKNARIADTEIEEIQALREGLQLDWTTLLLRTRELITVDAILADLKLPVLLDCGILSRKVSPRPYRKAKRSRFRMNCRFQQGVAGSLILLQLVLSTRPEGYQIEQIAFSPSLDDKTLYTGLSAHKCFIYPLDDSWASRRELAAVNPEFYIILGLLADLSTTYCEGGLSRVFPDVREMEDEFFCRRRASFNFGTPLESW